MADGKKIIRIGSVLRGNSGAISSVDRFVPAGIESVQFSFWNRISDEVNENWAESVAAACNDRNITISALTLFANPFAGGEEGAVASAGWEKLIKLASAAGVSLLSGFTGRLPGRSVDETITPVVEFFTPLLDKLEQLNLTLAFENCPMGGNWLYGNWNIAFCPGTWDILFNQKLKTDSLGLEFDPSHCIGYEQDAIALLKTWIGKVKHMHGKDAVVLPLETVPDGRLGKKAPYTEKFPGEGSLDWTKIFKLLEENNYDGTLDVEGYHGPFSSHEAEVEKQGKCIKYLKKCRGQEVTTAIRVP